MSKQAFLIIFFICFGITTEVFFTAIYETIEHWPNKGNKLEGHTYIWMAPIYSLIPLLFPLVVSQVNSVGYIFSVILV
jgi:hypothetical protein